MNDNKYLYFKNILYTYNILTYNKIDILDRHILLVTMLELLSYNFDKNLSYLLKNYFSRYNLVTKHIIDYKKVPSLRQICIKKIQDKKIPHYNLCEYLKLEINLPLFSIYDNKEKLLEFFYNIKKKDGKKFIDFLVKKYLEIQHDLPSICDYKPTRLPTS